MYDHILCTQKNWQQCVYTYIQDRIYIWANMGPKTTGDPIIARVANIHNEEHWRRKLGGGGGGARGYVPPHFFIGGGQSYVCAHHHPIFIFHLNYIFI